MGIFKEAQLTVWLLIFSCIHREVIESVIDFPCNNERQRTSNQCGGADTQVAVECGEEKRDVLGLARIEIFWNPSQASDRVACQTATPQLIQLTHSFDIPNMITRPMLRASKLCCRCYATNTSTTPPMLLKIRQALPLLSATPVTNIYLCAEKT